MTTWAELFQPVIEAGNIGGNAIAIRPQQAALGQAIINAISNKKALLGEARTGVGKSASYLLPAINYIKEHKGRVVVSTETLALQDQLSEKDAPFLHKTVGGFTFRNLKGRSWYLCWNHVQLAKQHHPRLVGMIEPLAHRDIRDGERRDVERLLHQRLADEEWRLISGSSEGCNDFRCAPDKCFAARARALALDTDLVLTNHAILRTNCEIDILGDFQVIIVDEAHTLEKVLIDGWTETITPWELSRDEGHVIDGIHAARSLRNGPECDSYMAIADQSVRALEHVLETTTKFFSLLAEKNGRTEWRRENFAVSLQYLSGTVTQDVVAAMIDYEEACPKLLETASKYFLECGVELLKLYDEAEGILRGKGRKKLAVGGRAAKRLGQFCSTLSKAITSRDGIVVDYGVPHGVTASGRINRDGVKQLAVSVTPLDVSVRAEEGLWRNRTPILVSATLTDPTDGTFKFIGKSLGVTDYTEIQVDSPFDYASKQLVYVTPGVASENVAPVVGAQFSFDELVSIINASRGRTLVLFTAKDELEYAAQALPHSIPYPILVQTDGCDKQALVDEFTHIEHSVLLGSKSFMTGVNFPGETCSTVVLCKFPLPQYNALCRQQIQHWKNRGYHKFYERESLLVFMQAAGRLIRAESDRGVVALLDRRAADKRERVYATASIGIRATGSEVVHNVEAVSKFFEIMA